MSGKKLIDGKYQNLLKFNVKRSSKGDNFELLIDDAWLDGLVGRFSLLGMGRLSYRRKKSKNIGDDTLILRSGSIEYTIPEDKVVTMVGRIITSAYTGARGQSFKIIGMEYFSKLRYPKGRPFIFPAYFCSENAYFRKKGN